jgi:hypothetical protein
MVNHPLRVRPLPRAIARFVASPVLAEYLRRNAVYSNIRLRATGFHFDYPTLEQGMRQIVDSLDA